jgi:rSAM-partnered protein
VSPPSPPLDPAEPLPPEFGGELSLNDDDPAQPASALAAATPSVFSTVRRSMVVRRVRLITRRLAGRRKVYAPDFHALKTVGTCSYTREEPTPMNDDQTGRSRVDAPRHDGVDEWEVFFRTEPTEPLFHAGSVTAATAEAAHEHAGALFEDAESIWLCPTDDVARFTTRTLGEDADADESASEGGRDADRSTEVTQ